MKKFFSVLFISVFALMCSTGISSCSKDDDAKPVDSSSIVGKWKLIHTDCWEKVNGKLVDSESEDEDYIMFGFYSNGTVDIYDDVPNEFDHTETWKVNGSTLLIYEDEKALAEGDVVTYKIESINNDPLVLSQYYSEKDEDGLWEDYIKMTFKRVK